ncbi:MAG: response regulator [Pseudomonadota bacterium]|nr:response regulator [Pseudomonadota bacterium]
MPPLPPDLPGTLLLVDDDPGTLQALQSLLRHDSYHVLIARSTQDALARMADQVVDVVVSGHHTPQLDGVDFLRRARQLHPETVRMVLSASTDLASVTEAINEGAICKFLSKPWDDSFLRASIVECFARKAISDENLRLDQELHRANEQLARYNETLKSALEEQRRRLQIGERALRLAKEGLDLVPVPVVGVDHAGHIVLVNAAATRLAPAGTWRIGSAACDALPERLPAIVQGGIGATPVEALFGRDWQVDVRPLGREERRGVLITLLPVDPAGLLADFHGTH